MKTKFILHGGYANHLNEENDSFFREILKDVSQEARILLVYFAKDDGDNEQRITLNKSLLEKNKRDKQLIFDVAEESRFVEQVKEADVVYLHGGKTHLLLEKLKQFPNLAELFEGKIVAGESAGAYVLSTCFYSKSQGGLFQGLGFVPVKIICHYIGENAEKLNECSGDLEVLLLKDYEFKIFE